jgi:hypothetical protein
VEEAAVAVIAESFRTPKPPKGGFRLYKLKSHYRFPNR